MNKHQRALKAARAAKRIPLVGTTVALLPLVRAFANAGTNLSNITNMAQLTHTGDLIVRNYTGVDPSNPTAGFQSQEIIATYGPIVAYIIARRVGIGKVIGHALSKVGLRF